MNRWLRPFSVRLLLAVAAMVFLLWLLPHHIWTLWQIKAFNPVNRAHPEYISAPIPDHLHGVEDWTWHLFPSFPVVVAASIGSILIYLLLGRITGTSARFETRCRTCRSVLQDLKEPACPACGDRL